MAAATLSVSWADIRKSDAIPIRIRRSKSMRKAPLFSRESSSYLPGLFAVKANFLHLPRRQENCNLSFNVVRISSELRSYMPQENKATWSILCYLLHTKLPRGQHWLKAGNWKGSSFLITHSKSSTTILTWRSESTLLPTDQHRLISLMGSCEWAAKIDLMFSFRNAAWRTLERQRGITILNAFNRAVTVKSTCG